MMDDVTLLRNAPMTVFFCGFRSDTLTLGREGWEFSMDQDMARMCLHVTMHHPELHMLGISSMVDTYNWRDSVQRMGRNMDEFPIRINNVYATGGYCKIVKQVHAIPEVTYRRVETEPMYQTMPTEQMNVEDWYLFKPIEQEIIIPEESVQDLLGRALELQKPIQEEIRERSKIREKREEYFRETKEEIKILSLVA